MRDPAGDRERMQRRRRNRKFIFIFASVVLITLLICILGATVRVFGSSSVTSPG
jgi:hypothetical protein